MSILNNIMKTMTLKELNKMHDEAKVDKSFRGGMLLSATGRELGRRKDLKRKKK